MANIATSIGDGIGMICLALAIVIIYRGCGDKGSLLPPVFQAEESQPSSAISSPDSIQWPNSHP